MDFDKLWRKLLGLPTKEDREKNKKDPERDYELEIVKRILQRFPQKLRGNLEQEDMISYLHAIEVSMINTEWCMKTMICVIKDQQATILEETGNNAYDISPYWNNVFKD